MPPDLALIATLIGSNYPCLELIFTVPEMFEPLKFDCSSKWGEKSFTQAFKPFHLIKIYHFKIRNQQNLCFLFCFAASHCFSLFESIPD